MTGVTLAAPVTSRSRRDLTVDAVRVAVIAGVYVGAAKLGIELSVAHGVITPVWAPAGIALASLVLFGPRLWPAVALGALIANATSGASIVEAVVISTGNTLEAVVGATVLRRIGFRPALDRVRDVLALASIGAIASTTIAATNGVTTLWIAGDSSSYGSDWHLWWIGDGMGVLVVAPFLLVWVASRPRVEHGPASPEHPPRLAVVENDPVLVRERLASLDGGAHGVAYARAIVGVDPPDIALVVDRGSQWDAVDVVQLVRPGDAVRRDVPLPAPDVRDGLRFR